MVRPDPLFALNRRRIELLTVVIGAGAGVWATVVWGSRYGIGVIAGAFLSLLNYIWLKKAVVSLGVQSSAQAEREEGGKRPSKRLHLRLVGRYVLVLTTACVILFGFKLPVVAFLSGLFALVAAVLVEMISQLFRRTRES